MNEQKNKKTTRGKLYSIKSLDVSLREGGYGIEVMQDLDDNMKEKEENYKESNNMHIQSEARRQSNDNNNEIERKKSFNLSSTQRKILGSKLADKIRKQPSKNRDSNKCLICFENSPDGVFMNCGHGGFCTTCAFEMVEIKNECHLCRQEIKQVVQLKFPVNYNNVYQALCITDIVVESEIDPNAKEIPKPQEVDIEETYRDCSREVEIEGMKDIEVPVKRMGTEESNYGNAD